jgi:DNA topoisomerase-1
MTILLIVESPAKAKTISKYLGKDYIIRASYGHVRDLEKNKLGIDIENGFKPTYKILPTRSKQVKELIDISKKVDQVYLASDEDREGEAIAFHIAQILKIDPKLNNRITFHEITKKALETAVKNPRKIDMNMVDSQQARRILDRLVGFKLSPILWKYVSPKLSAGRVQSVCLKLIIEKENQINSFTSNSQFKISGFFNKDINALLNRHFNNKTESMEFLQFLNSKEIIFTISDIIKKIEEKRPPSPYTTSTIVQDINSRFHINPKMIMSVLQKLYENGKITYHRTDSTNLCEQIMNQIKDYVIDKYKDKYYKRRYYKSSQKNAQEAHEAIRPTNILEDNIDGNIFSSNEKRVYRLIWSRTVASQMSNAVFDKMIISISISNREELFITNIVKKIFDGYTILYDNTNDKTNDKTNDNQEEVFSTLKGEIKKGDILLLSKGVAEEKYQTPPPRYTDGTIVKRMEKLGIGRPSTYANIIETILERKYIIRDNIEGIEKICTVLTASNYRSTNFQIKEDEKKLLLGAEKNKLIPTPLGITTNDFLDKNFIDIMKYDFTSQMEDNLDKICDGKLKWQDTIKEFYDKLSINMNNLNSADTIEENKQFKFKTEKRLLGSVDNEPYFIYNSKFGPVIQIGETEKRYINLDKKTNINKFTLEDLGKIDIYPKNMGKYKDIDIFLKKGKYGIYIEYNGKNYKTDELSKKEASYENISNCIMNADNSSSKSRKIGKYDIKHGKYGYYLFHNKKIVGLPKDMKIENITEEIIRELLANSSSKKKF